MQTTVMYSNHAAGRDEKLFPNPFKFDPERWKKGNKYAFAIQPFGFGQRMCFGMAFPGPIDAFTRCCFLNCQSDSTVEYLQA